MRFSPWMIVTRGDKRVEGTAVNRLTRWFRRWYFRLTWREWR